MRPGKQRLISEKILKNDPSIFIAGVTLAVQQKDRGLCMHGVTVETNNDNHRGHTYTILVKKTARFMTWNSEHIQGTL